MGRRLVWVAWSGKASLGRWKSNKELDHQKTGVQMWKVGEDTWSLPVAATHGEGQAGRAGRSRQEATRGACRAPTKQGLRDIFEMFWIF